ncbi:MAG: peptidylprolyl isomerase [Flavobacteriales bacterium]|jgi:peptidylprolyl isomerase/peptidyl-prolyl cis-trans isomerase A (cyclophilin A)|tara:strand:- start:927 stop:1511 length:585 start_codon:yes stop_codon:yes gene_type:complete
MKIKQISTLFIVLFLTLTNCKKEDENISEPDPNATISEVRFYTNKGDFVVELEDKLAPITSSNFLKLVNEKFYDGIIFHRVLQNFIIQGGDPTGTGSGGPGYSIQDEFHEDLSNIEKTISMANSGPNTGGSQFFFNMKDNTFLDYNESPSTSKHAVFGKVISGYSIVQTISNVSVNSQDRPITDVVIDSIRKIN